MLDLAIVFAIVLPQAGELTLDAERPLDELLDSLFEMVDAAVLSEFMKSVFNPLLKSREPLLDPAFEAHASAIVMPLVAGNVTAAGVNVAVTGSPIAAPVESTS